MRPIVAVLFTLAAVASAAPSTDNHKANVLHVRQECIYSCGCSTIDNIPADTDRCCTVAGGVYDGERCNELTIPTHTTFKDCCSSGSSVCFAPRGCPL